MKTTHEVFKEVLKELGFDGFKPDQMTNSDYWLCSNTAMKRFAEAYHNSKIDAVTEEEIHVACEQRKYSITYNSGHPEDVFYMGVKWREEKLKQ